MKYYLIAASKDHVLKGFEKGFAQAGHGRKDYISKPAKGDKIVYYSAKDKFENGTPLQKFTAMGKVTDDEVYQPDIKSGFKPYRRNVQFYKVKETSIRPLIDQLSFIKNKKRWGFYLISGFREIPKEDYELIEKAMK